MSDELSEQERVMFAAGVLSAYKWVNKSPSRARKWQDDQTRVGSGEIMMLTGIPMDVVEAAVMNVAERVDA